MYVCIFLHFFYKYICILFLYYLLVFYLIANSTKLNRENYVNFILTFILFWIKMEFVSPKNVTKLIALLQGPTLKSEWGGGGGTSLMRGKITIYFFSFFPFLLIWGEGLPILFKGGESTLFFPFISLSHYLSI